MQANADSQSTRARSQLPPELMQVQQKSAHEQQHNSCRAAAEQLPSCNRAAWHASLGLWVCGFVSVYPNFTSNLKRMRLSFEKNAPSITANTATMQTAPRQEKQAQDKRQRKQQQCDSGHDTTRPSRILAKTPPGHLDSVNVYHLQRLLQFT